MNLIDYILLNFTYKELEVYRMYHIERKNFMEIAKEHKVTRERIRQIHAKISEKIKTGEIDLTLEIKLKRIYRYE